MSPNTANSLVHDLVEMAKAMDVLPQVQHDLAEAKGTIENLQQAVQDRELRAIEYKRQIEELWCKVRATEAERDDAEMRFLEADDRMLKLERTFQKSLEAADAVDKLIQSFKPVTPQPEPIVEAQPQVQSEAPPTTAATGEGKSEMTSATSSANEDATSISQGQGEANPTANETTTQQETVSGTNAGNETNVSGADKPSGPYTNKHYYDHPTYVPLHDWLEGGGTEADYNWRPSVGASA